MKELRLEDIGNILLALAALFIVYVAVRLLIAFLPQLGMLIRATTARYINGDWWQSFLDWLADRSVNDYEDGDRVMSRPATGSVSGDVEHELVRRNVVLPDTNHAEPETVEKLKTVSISHNIENRELAIMLAAQKTFDGKARWSANEIAKFVGGTRQDVLEWIAIVRPREKVVEPIQQKAEAITPITGRPYDPKKYHLDDPSLQYVEPDA